MLDQLFNIVKQFGENSVVNNPEVPNEYNQEVMADATSTITSGFQNIIAGGGLQNILDLFKRGGNSGGSSGTGDLLKNPIITMMIGFFISKLVSKYKMSPSAASSVANNIIPGSITNLIQQTNDPNNENVTMDRLVNSLVGKGEQEEQNANSKGSPLQDILDQFTGGGGNSGSAGGFNIQDLIGNFTKKAQNNLQHKQQGGSDGLMDMIKGFFSN